MTLKLSEWTLRLPIDANRDGSADVAPSTADKSPWYDIYNSGANIKFVCPSTGATSTNASKPRTELTQKTSKKWTHGQLSYTGTVKHSSVTKTCIAQIWSEKKNGPRVMVMYEPGSEKLYFRDNHLDGSRTERFFNFLPKVGQDFNLRLRLDNGKIGIRASVSSSSQELTVPVGSGWGSYYWFKFGTYGGPIEFHTRNMTFSST
jgi:hypothetical protein